LRSKSPLVCLKPYQGGSFLPLIFLLVRYLQQPWSKIDPTVVTVYVVLAVLHLLCGLSLDTCAFILSGIGASLKTFVQGRGSKRDEDILKVVAFHPRTVISSLSLDPIFQSFISCPKCGCLYQYNKISNTSNAHVDSMIDMISNAINNMDLESDSDSSSDSDSKAPQSCTYKKTSASPSCGRSLYQPRMSRGKVSDAPVRQFLYQDFKNWLAALLCRPGMEDLMNHFPSSSSSPSLSPSSSSSSSSSSIATTVLLRDIWDGSVMKDFRGPKGKPFISSHSEGCYRFAFTWDGFNPWGNKEAGKIATVSAMYMVCLNLPPRLRYRPENIFLVGLIPGPTEPTVDQFHHFLKPLVDDLLILWDSGMRLNATPRYPNGRTVQAAVVALVADLPATRTAAGFAHHSSSFMCSFCLLPLQDITNLSRESWPKRSCQDHKHLATEWNNAETVEQQEALFKSHGVRYSELLRLPYWDPVNFVAIDSMHGFYLGLLARHCKVIWGFNVNAPDGDGTETRITPPNRPDPEKMEEAIELFRELTSGNRSPNSLQRLTVSQLYHLCSEHNCLPLERFQKRKKHLMRALEAYVSIFKSSQLERF